MNKRNVEKYKEALSKQVKITKPEDEPEAVRENKVFTVNPPEDEPEPKVKYVTEEVDYSQYSLGEQEFKDKDGTDYTKEIKGMIGSTADVVEKYLKALKEKNVIADFRVMPIGALIDFEQRPGVVTATKDKENLVINIEIS